MDITVTSIAAIAADMSSAAIVAEPMQSRIIVTVVGIGPIAKDTITASGLSSANLG